MIYFASTVAGAENEDRLCDKSPRRSMCAAGDRKMSFMSNRLFKMAAAPALALASLSSAAVPFAAANAQERPVAAQPVAANTNVQQVSFATFNDSNRSVRFVQAGAAEASRDKIAIIVWGGNRDLQQQAYNAALDLRDQGIPLAFIVGPDLNGVDADANFQVYARGVPAFDADGARFGLDHIMKVRPEVTRMGLEAYARGFPREAAALGMSPR